MEVYTLRSMRGKILKPPSGFPFDEPYVYTNKLWDKSNSVFDVVSTALQS